MINIITGSTLGGAEYVGDHLSELLEAKGYDTAIYNQPNLENIPTDGYWLIITSTHGAGDYPENIHAFIHSLKNTPPKTSQLNYAVIGIGDSSYDTFCYAALHLYDLLESIGATPLCHCFTIDVLKHQVPEDAATEWLNSNIHIFKNDQ